MEQLDQPTAEPSHHTVLVHESRIDTVRAALSQLSRRAQKLGLPPIACIYGAPTERPVPRKKPGEAVEYAIYFPLSLEQRVVRLNGWRFLAALDNVDGRVLIRGVPGVELGESARTLTPEWCDHCRTERRRNSTYLLEHEDGRRRQVGSTCLVDFMGHPDAVTVARTATELLETLDGCDDVDASCSPQHDYIHVERFLAFVAMLVRQLGWRSRAAAEHVGRATADLALSLYTAKRQDLAPDQIPTEEDRTLAGATKAWVRDTFQNRALNDYEYNLSVAINAEVIAFRHAGIAASAISAYQRSRGELSLASAPARLDAHFGTVGKRTTFKAFLVDKRSFSSDLSGESTRHRFVTETGHYLCWWTSTDGLPRGNIDAVRTFKATVKAHDFDKAGQRETKITRVVELTEAAPRPNEALAVASADGAAAE